MLVQCSIRNFAVIESISVAFDQGFNVLTGETGAGKSIIVDALGMLIGGRGSAEFVRHGADKAEIEALFEISEIHPVYSILQSYGIPISEDNALLLKREITQQGKSISRINGQLVNQTMLKEIGQWLVNIHGQHEHQSLLKSERHIDWLDSFGDSLFQQLKTEVIQQVRQYNDLLKEWRELHRQEQEMIQKKDLLDFQVKEIQKARLKLKEEESLFEESKRLSHAEKIRSGLNEAYDGLIGDNQGLDNLTRSIQAIEEIVSFDPSLSGLLEQLQAAYYQIEDGAAELRSVLDRLEIDPDRLFQVEQRLDVIHSLKRKYGLSIEAILAHAASAEQELHRIDHREEILTELKAKIDKLTSDLADKTATLSKRRQELASVLGEKIEAELHQLHMERAKFTIQVKQIEDKNGFVSQKGESVKLFSNGIDYVEFLIAPNPGEPYRPLAKIASGGELSRMMLAIKTILSSVDQVATLVFDEVDTGVSGRAAQSIAEKLVQVAKNAQVFSITHLPQVACMADTHYLIEKQQQLDSTRTYIHPLSSSERIQELARMLGGVEVTSVTEQHAKEMLELAEHKKDKLVAS